MDTFTAGEAALTRVEKIGECTYLIGVESRGQDSDASPGQFFMIRGWAGSPPLWNKPFSICDIVGDELLFMVRTYGGGTRTLVDKRPGDRLTLIGPLGSRLRFTKKGASYLLIAGGIGIAPFPLLVRHLREFAPRARMTLVYGERTASLAVDAKKLIGPDVEIILTTDDGSAGHKGNSVDAITGRISRDTDTVIIACGPKPMLRAIQVHPACRETELVFFMEELMACGYGVCSGCVIRVKDGDGVSYARVCMEGPVFDGKKVVL